VEHQSPHRRLTDNTLYCLILDLTALSVLFGGDTAHRTSPLSDFTESNWLSSIAAEILATITKKYIENGDRNAEMCIALNAVFRELAC